MTRESRKWYLQAAVEGALGMVMFIALAAFAPVIPAWVRCLCLMFFWLNGLFVLDAMTAARAAR